MHKPSFKSERERDDFIAASLAYYGHGPQVGGKRTDYVPQSHGAPDHVDSLRVLVNQPWKSYRQASKRDRRAKRELRAVTHVKVATQSLASRDIALMDTFGSVHDVS